MNPIRLPIAVTNIGGLDPATWDSRLLCCCDNPDFGVNCVVQSVCCQPCIMASAMGWSECSSPVLTFVGLTCCVQAPIGQLTGFLARRHVVEKYKIVENPVASCLTVCCCLPCSNLQVVNEVVRQEDLSYECARIGPSKVVGVPVVDMERV